MSRRQNKKFIFQDAGWLGRIKPDHIVTLSHNHRAASDPVFARMLDIASEDLVGVGRAGRADVQWAIKGLRRCMNRPWPNGVIPAFVVGTNALAKRLNREELVSLQGAQYVFQMSMAEEVTGAASPFYAEMLAAIEHSRRNDGDNEKLRSLGVYSHVEVVLKTGAQVLIIHNDSAPVMVQDENGMYHRIPMATKDLVKGGRAAVHGWHNEDDTDWPVVILANGTLVLCKVKEMSHDKGDGKCVLVTQLVFVLGWAVTVHRAQGIGLDCMAAILNRGQIWENNQACVAMGRATSCDALHVLAFDPAVVVTFPAVKRCHRMRSDLITSDGEM